MQTKDIILSEGLQGQDDNLDILIALWEQLQLATVDAAHPELDLLTFAQSASYFAIILKAPERPAGGELPTTGAGPTNPMQTVCILFSAHVLSLTAIIGFLTSRLIRPSPYSLQPTALGDAMPAG